MHTFKVLTFNINKISKCHYQELEKKNGPTFIYFYTIQKPPIKLLLRTDQKLIRSEPFLFFQLFNLFLVLPKPLQQAIHFLFLLFSDLEPVKVLLLLAPFVLF